MKQCSIYNSPIKNVQPKEHIDFAALVELIRGDTYKERTKKLRALSDGEYKAFKNQNLDHVTFAGTFSTRNNSGLVEPSGLMVFDMDDLENPEWHKEKISRDTLVEIALIFKSPSGKGLKIVVWVDLREGNHAQHYLTVKKHFENEYNLTVDHAPDVARTCFLCHDPKAYVNESFLSEWPTESFTRLPVLKFETEHARKHKPAKNRVHLLDELKIKYIIDQLRQQGIDLTEQESEWSRLRFAFASLGEVGRPLFHQLSSIYPNYRQEETDKKFDYGLENYKAVIGIKAFYEAAKKHGIDTREYPASDSIFQNFLDDQFNNIPELLQPSLNYLENPTEKFVFLVSVLASISGFIPNVYTMVEGKRIQPNHFLIITGPAASGKSATNYAKFYLYRFEEWMKGDNNVGPFITANSSKTHLLKVLENSNGCGILFANEIDTLGTTLKQDWGDFTDLLRNGYDNVSDEAARMDKERKAFVKQLNFALVLTGTQNQLFTLIKNAENGMLSRVLIVELFEYRKLRNIFATKKDYAAYLKAQGEQLSKRLLENWEKLPPIEVTIEDELANEIWTFFDELGSKYGHVSWSLIPRYQITSIKLLLTIAFINSDEEHPPVIENKDWELVKELIILYMIFIEGLYFSLERNNLSQYRKMSDNDQKPILQQLIKEGLSNVQMGEVIGMSEASVRKHREKYTL
jgi:hypothetical protein